MLFLDDSFVATEALSEEQRIAVAWRFGIEVFIGAFLLMVVLDSSLTGIYYVWIVQMVNQGLRVKMIENAEHLSLRFHNHARAGDAIYRVFQDSAAITGVLDTLYLDFVEMTIRLTIAIAVLWIFDPVLGLLAIAVTVPVAWMVKWFTPACSGDRAWPGARAATSRRAFKRSSQQSASSRQTKPRIDEPIRRHGDRDQRRGNDHNAAGEIAERCKKQHAPHPDQVDERAAEQQRERESDEGGGDDFADHGRRPREIEEIEHLALQVRGDVRPHGKPQADHEDREIRQHEQQAPVIRQFPLPREASVYYCGLGNRIAIVKYFWLGLGWVSVALGVAGAVLPLLPTTPFLLLAAFSFSKGSDKLHDWLIGHPYLGPPITNWRDKRVVTRSTKVSATIFMAVFVVIALVMQIPAWALVPQVAISVGVGIMLWLQKEA